MTTVRNTKRQGTSQGTMISSNSVKFHSFFCKIVTYCEKKFRNHLKRTATPSNLFAGHRRSYDILGVPHRPLSANSGAVRAPRLPRVAGVMMGSCLYEL